MRLRYFYPLFLVLFFLLFLLVHLVFFNRVYRPSDKEISIRIKRGENLRNVASELEKEQVIYNKYIFILAGRLLGYQDEIIPGEYQFRNGLTNIAVLKMITDVTGHRYFSVTIPEGLNVRQIGHLLKRQLDLDSSQFVKDTYDDSLIALIGIKTDHLEGFLFPDTYSISIGPGSNAEKDIVETMTANFRKKITPEMYEQMKKKKLNLKDVITMASIIEAETRYNPEKKTIAGVYYNRLKKRMKLEADPTVQYALPDGPKKRLTYSDLKYSSPYNTYLNRGLPPGPINNPGLSSIEAALYPEQNKYLYFVARGDGTHRFAETFEQHKQNIEEYRKFLEEQERINK
jgi:UPF0755 protein